MALKKLTRMNGSIDHSAAKTRGAKHPAKKRRPRRGLRLTAGGQTQGTASGPTIKLVSPNPGGTYAVGTSLQVTAVCRIVAGSLQAPKAFLVDVGTNGGSDIISGTNTGTTANPAWTFTLNTANVNYALQVCVMNGNTVLASDGTLIEVT